MASVIFRRGDLFEGGADLTVLPCSDRAHISKTAETHVDHFGLPLPKVKAICEIEVAEFPGSGKITRFIAWAATVTDYHSSVEIVRVIGNRIGQYANEHIEIQVVETPLLGTGVGSLDPLDAGPALAAGFLDTCTTDAALFVHAQPAKLIEALRKKTHTETLHNAIGTTDKTPTAFLSYCRESVEFEEWVRNVATRLRTDGVDAKLDQWLIGPGENFAQFMETIDSNDYVLIFCTPEYRRKHVSRTGGVGYESDIISAGILAGRQKGKIIPILAKGTWEESVPSLLRVTRGVDLSGSSSFHSEYKELLDTLRGKRDQAPPLG